MENFNFTWPHSVWTQFIYASILGPIFNCDYLNKDCITLPWPRHRITTQATSVLLLALTQSEKHSNSLKPRHTQTPTHHHLFCGYLNKTNQTMSVILIGFAKLASDLYGAAVTRGTQRYTRRTSTDMWKQQLLKQLWQHPTYLSDHGPSTLPLLKHWCPQFFYVQGQYCSSIPLLRSRVNMPRGSSREHTFPRVNSFCHSSPLILYSPELPNICKAFLLQQPFSKYT